jgi:hypothetical protein
LTEERVTPAEGLTVQVPVSFRAGVLPVRIKGEELQIVWFDPAMEVVGAGDATVTVTSAWVFAQLFPLNINQRKSYFPGIRLDIGELLR